MLLKLTSNVSIDGIEHKAGTVIDPEEKGISADSLLIWRWAVEIDKTESDEPALEPITPAAESVTDPIAEPVETIAEPAEQPPEPPAPKAPRRARK